MKLEYVTTGEQVADTLTKGLDHEKLGFTTRTRSKLNIATALPMIPIMSVGLNLMFEGVWRRLGLGGQVCVRIGSKLTILVFFVTVMSMSMSTSITFWSGSWTVQRPIFECGAYIWA
jgi:hypothetical protein